VVTRPIGYLALAIALASPGIAAVAAQQAGGVRGVVYDKDFGAPIGNAKVEILELRKSVTASEDGNYVFTDVPAGSYTLLFTKDGYTRQVRSEVVVAEGALVDVDASLSGEFTDMDEFVVQEVQLGGTEGALLQLRLESPSLLDSIGSELLSKAGRSDVAEALSLVPGASVQDGKYAVVRGLPDRYVVSQINGIRLPTADAEKRAVQLDQFPTAIVESVQVSKTFTPDQQGDASGGAVNVILKNIPDELTFQIKGQVGFNSQVKGADNFLTYDDGGVSFWGFDDGSRDIQANNIGGNWDGAVGVTNGSPPTEYKWSVSGGGSVEIDDGVKVGGFASLFYEQDVSFFDNGIDDSYWVETPGGPMVPEKTQDNGPEDFKTKLLDVTQSSTMVQWGALGSFGVETENHKVGVTYLYTHDAEDTVTLAEDTRGKEYYFPGYSLQGTGPGSGNDPFELKVAPYLRLETLDYVERTTTSLQFKGTHTLPIDDFDIDESFGFRSPVFDWTFSSNSAQYYEPDKRQFGTEFTPGFELFPGFVIPPSQSPFKPDANFNLGNLQRIYKDINEDSTQYALNLTLPFAQWTETEGYFKFGYFNDQVTRTYEQETFSNFGDNSTFQGDWNQFWSAAFPTEKPPDHGRRSSTSTTRATSRIAAAMR
jgi:hypothetical protein